MFIPTFQFFRRSRVTSGQFVAAIAVAASSVGGAVAQTAPTVTTQIEAAPGPQNVNAPAPTRLTIPALTPVNLQIMADLGSNTSKNGQKFALRLTTPVVLDGHEVIPAGTTGEGEVLNAKHSGIAGSAGILTLVANNLSVDGRTLRLRSMHVGEVGKDSSKTVGLMSPIPVIGLAMFFTSGGVATVPSGTVATAKTAEDFSIDMPAPAQGNVAPASQDAKPPFTTTEGSKP